MANYNFTEIICSVNDAVFKSRDEKIDFLNDISKVYIKYNINPNPIKRIIEEINVENLIQNYSQSFIQNHTSKTEISDNSNKKDMAAANKAKDDMGRLPVFSENDNNITSLKESYSERDKIISAILEHPAFNNIAGKTIKGNNLIKYLCRILKISITKDELIEIVQGNLCNVLYYNSLNNKFELISKDRSYQRHEEENLKSFKKKQTKRATFDNGTANRNKALNDNNLSQQDEYPYLKELLYKRSKGKELTGMEEDYLNETLRDRKVNICSSCIHSCYKSGLHVCAKYERYEMKATRIRNIAYKK